MLENYYVVYLRKTDEIKASGTAKECASQLGIGLNHFYSLVSKNKRGIHHKYYIYQENEK